MWGQSSESGHRTSFEPLNRYSRRRGYRSCHELVCAQVCLSGLNTAEPRLGEVGYLVDETYLRHSVQFTRLPNAFTTNHLAVVMPMIVETNSG